jgi:Undecaprenyl-phosphate galactose phosphotransferase WbaP
VPRTALRRDPLPWRSSGPVVSAAALLAADVASWLAAVGLDLALRAWLTEPAPILWVTWTAGVSWILLRIAAGLYPPRGISPPDELRHSFLTVAGGVTVHAIVLVTLREWEATRFLGLLIWLFVLPIAWFVRTWIKLILVRHRLYGRPYVVFGTGENAFRAIREMLANPEYGLVPVAVFGDENADLWGRDILGVPVLGPMREITRVEFPYPVAHAVVAIGRREGTATRVNEIATEFADRFPTLLVFPFLMGLANLLIRPRPLGPFLALEIQNVRFSTPNRILKRALDLAVGIPVFVVALPILAAAAVAVKLVSPGPAFFSQTREGRGGKPIRIWKIRTMVPDAADRLQELLEDDTGARSEWATTVKLRNDPRIIPGVGWLLRRSSIDELPQLWNVVAGEMSLVGPRIMPTPEVEQYSEAGKRLRREVPPGLTGLWQVQHRSDGDFQVRDVADSYYVTNWTIWMDLWLLLRTVRVVLLGSGAY